MAEDKDKIGGRGGGADSGGGAYPNPHSGKQGDRGGFMDHGGQTEMPYHGSTQLGEDKVGKNSDAPPRKTQADKDDGPFAGEQ